MSQAVKPTQDWESQVLQPWEDVKQDTTTIENKVYLVCPGCKKPIMEHESMVHFGEQWHQSCREARRRPTPPGPVPPGQVELFHGTGVPPVRVEAENVEKVQELVKDFMATRPHADNSQGSSTAALPAASRPSHRRRSRTGNASWWRS